jgi:hypothetical protein
MTSCDAVVGCGASGIAWADMDIRPRPSANTDAARIFIGYFLSFLFRRDAAESVYANNMAAR